MGSLGAARDIDLDYGAASGLRAAYSKSVLYSHLLDKFRTLPGNGEAQSLPQSRWSLPRREDLPHHVKHDQAPEHSEKICIVGAGMAGLHAAMLLQEAGFYNIDIFEAADRAGGRMFTYEFPKDEDHKAKNNYCDMGAMRLPDIPRMAPTFKLIKKLGLEDKQREYVLNIKEKDGPLEPNLWGFKNEVPKSKDFDEVLKSFFVRFNFLDKGNFSAAFQKFMNRGFDEYSTRAWLMLNQHLTYEETETAEASDTSTGLFDQALIETICDYVDFQAAESVHWYRIEGGMKTIIDKMVEKLQTAARTKVHMSMPVKALINNELADPNDKTMTVVTKDGQHHKYAAVFNTTALPCLQRMDLSRLSLPDEILTGIRTLSYDRATKVAIKFSKPWWRDYLRAEGGVSSTDLPISKVVYPSWTEDEGNVCVLLASYSWAQDATRMGALFQNPRPGAQTEPNCEEDVVTLCLENLAQIWSKVPSDYKGPRTVEELRELYVDHFAYAWSHDPNQGGAYALFGPGQFRYVYPRFLELQCNNKFAMIGEALSHEHAWISGAINSAEWGVARWLCQNGYKHSCWHLKKSDTAIYVGPDEDLFDAMDEEMLYWSMYLGEGIDGDKQPWKGTTERF